MISKENKEKLFNKLHNFPTGNRDQKTIYVDTLVIGSGPAALGFFVNALKTGRLNDLMRFKDGQHSNNNGLAIISEEISFGAGDLGNYGINSNTSATGFMKCMNRIGKKKKDNVVEKNKNFVKQND